MTGPLPDPGRPDQAATPAQRALIVAHGQPSDPGPAEAALARFAQRVAAELPAGWLVSSATLAAPGALEAALARAGTGAAPLLIYPMFIADGWFTQVNLPARLRAAGAEVTRLEADDGAGSALGPGGAKAAASSAAASRREGAVAPEVTKRGAQGLAQGASPATGRSAARILPPFGLDPGILPLALHALRTALAEAGLRAAETRLIVAAHGSFKSPAPAMVARRLARAIIAELPFAEMRTAFIDQTPRIADFARGLSAPALCLPLFAAAGGHVEEDLPAALAEAGFAGRVLPPLGLAPGAPGLVASALREASAGRGR